MPGEQVLSVSFTRTALIVTMAKLRSAKLLWEPEVLVDYSLGYDNHGSWNDGYGISYWDAVEQAVRSIMVRRPLLTRPEKILLQGECAGQKDFLDMLQHALEGLVEDGPGKIVHHDNVFVAALGAAEFAKRALLDEKHSNRTWSTLEPEEKKETVYKLDM